MLVCEDLACETSLLRFISCYSTPDSPKSLSICPSAWCFACAVSGCPPFFISSLFSKMTSFENSPFLTLPPRQDYLYLQTFLSLNKICCYVLLLCKAEWQRNRELDQSSSHWFLPNSWGWVRAKPEAVNSMTGTQVPSSPCAAPRCIPRSWVGNADSQWPLRHMKQQLNLLRPNTGPYFCL